MNQEEYDLLRKSCLDNAQSLLDAAKKLTGPNERHISYFLAELALEEVGKLEMAGMQAAIAPKLPIDQQVRLDVEDHERKLFWALWGPSIGGKELITKAQIDSFLGLAKTIYKKRLSSLYVDINRPAEQSKIIKKSELTNMLKLTEARLGMANMQGSMRMDEELYKEDERDRLEWFLNASGDQYERSFMFNGESNKKLSELGDSKKWVKWLYDEAMKRKDESDAAIKEELAREKPTKSEVLTPKWRMKIKLSSPSHSIRQNVLDDWNKRVDLIKMYKGKTSHDLVLEIILTKNVNIKDLWAVGLDRSKLFVTVLNLATQGYVWWNVDADKARYYDSLEDIEKNMHLSAETTEFKIDWTGSHLVLDQQTLGRVGMVFSYLTTLHKNEAAVRAFNRYTLGLSLIAKHDVHLRLDRNAWESLYGAFKDLVIALGEQAEGETIEDCLRRIVPEQLHEALNRCFELEELIKKDETYRPTLDDIFITKIMMDFFVLNKAQVWASKYKTKKRSKK